MTHTMTETEKLAQAVELAFKTFSEYADLHRAKGTRDGDAKADRNADLATTMCEALTAWNTRPAPALDREGVARALFRAAFTGPEWSDENWPLDVNPVDRARIERDADAILAMVGGGASAEYSIVHGQTHVEEKIGTVENVYMSGVPALDRERVARLFAMADVAAGYPADDEDQSFDAPASTVEG